MNRPPVVQPYPPTLIYACPAPACPWQYHAPSVDGDRHSRAFARHWDRDHAYVQLELGAPS